MRAALAAAVLAVIASVPAEAAPKRILATGDSMIQLVDLELAKRLEPPHSVRSDARVGTGISKPRQLDWVRHSRRQALRHRPHATVVFLGANDGFPLRGARCCGERWVARYAARVRAAMDHYRRAGRGRVYWLTLPAPRPRLWRPIYSAVNRAIRRAGRSFPRSAGVRVIDTWKVFTPDGRFRARMSWRGRKYTVRQADGVHLSRAGASIAAQLIVGSLRNDAVVQ